MKILVADVMKLTIQFQSGHKNCMQSKPLCPWRDVRATQPTTKKAGSLFTLHPDSSKKPPKLGLQNLQKISRKYRNLPKLNLLSDHKALLRHLSSFIKQHFFQQFYVTI